MEAEGGTASDKYMTPQRTKQAILALAPQGAAISDGSKGDITVAGNVWTVAPLPASRVGLANVSNYATASQVEAEAGAAADKYMTPQRTKQAILALAPQGAAISDGSKGDITVAGNVWTVAPLPASRVGLANVSNYATASQVEAEAGAAADKYMTPQRTKQAILALAPQSPAISDGSKGDITVAGNVWTVAPLPASRVGLANVSNYATASQVEAEAGTASDKVHDAAAYEAGDPRARSAKPRDLRWIERRYHGRW